MGACGNQKQSKGPIVANKVPQQLKVENTPETKTGEPNSEKKPVPVQSGQEILVKIYRDSNERPLVEKKFDGSKLLIQVVQSVVRELPLQAEFCLVNYQGQDITASKNKRLSELANGQDSFVVTIKYLGLDINPNVRKGYQEINIIGAPRYETDPLELTTYDKTTNQLKTLMVNRSHKDLVKDFGYFSSFCNGKNSLFLSGGEREKKGEKGTETESIGNFVSIDLTNGKVKTLKNLIRPRNMHSSIYIPDKWVFIVGGTDTKIVELYDIEKNTICEDSLLNEERSEPSLCCVNNTHLYAFCGFRYKFDYSNTIERCNLQVKARSWEKVKYTCGVGPFSIYFFATAYLKDKILLLGGSSGASDKSYNEKNYLYNPANDTIEPATNVIPCTDVFPEKFFIPLKDDMSAIVPFQLNSQSKVFTLKESGKLDSLVLQDASDDNQRSSFKA